MSYLEQLLEFLTTPYGLIGLGLSVFVLSHASEVYRRQHWFLVGLFGFAASLNEFSDRWGREAPALVFPLQQLRDAGRPLAVLLLFLLLLIAFKTRTGWRSPHLPSPVPYLIIVQLVVFLKNLLSGNFIFAFVSLIVFAAIVLMMRQGPTRWLQDRRNLELGFWSIAIVGIIFIVANLYQASINFYAISFFHGLFMGTTGNPQHAAILLTSTIPCLLFLTQKPDQSRTIKWLWMLCLGITAFGLMLTGSRTGVLSATISIVLFYRYRLGKFFKLVLGVAILIGISWLFIPNEQVLTDAVKSVGSPLDKLGSRVNTRTDVWEAQWRIFMRYPLFGSPVTEGRFRYGESSWLGAASSLGLLGFIPMVLFGIEYIKMILRLDRIAINNPNLYIYCSVVIAGLGSLLVGSLSESYLLGNITFPLTALLLYQVLGTYLIEVEQKMLRQSRASQIASSGT